MIVMQDNITKLQAVLTDLVLKIHYFNHLISELIVFLKLSLPSLFSKRDELLLYLLHALYFTSFLFSSSGTFQLSTVFNVYILQLIWNILQL